MSSRVRGGPKLPSPSRGHLITKSICAVVLVFILTLAVENSGPAADVAPKGTAIGDLSDDYLDRFAPISPQGPAQTFPAHRDAGYHPAAAATTQTLIQMFPKGRIGAVVRDLNTGATLFSINGNQRFVPASTYKLFVAYTVLNAIDAGKTSWNANIAGDTNKNCMFDMIVYSANECAEAWLWHFGYEKVEKDARSIHAANTTFAENALETTPSDLAVFLQGLYDDSLLSSDSKEHLLTLMKKQERRDGIPAGLKESATSELVVADKIGNLDGMIRDAAIVYAPEGDFVMVIMIDGYDDFSNIAKAAEVIYAAITD